MSKFERQGAILRLVRERELSTQAEVADALRSEGIDAVQATVSRDITQLGLVKVRASGGRLVYALPGAADLARLSELATALKRWAQSIVASGNLVVVQTPSGCAPPLAQAVDEARLADVAGTVAGDNTILVVARDGVSGTELEDQLRLHLEGEGAA
jgi:transcriptional regulator of arginine metabolism